MTLLDAITRAEPDELYNLAATSFVPASWRQPVMTAQFTAVGVTSMLEAVRITNPELRVYQASTSEMFGATTESPQHERSRFVPHNPYAVAKLYGHLMVSTYRERYGMHASSGILYNHESPRRPPEFVSRKCHADRCSDQARPRQGTAPWATSRRGATGASPATSPRRCGSCCSSTPATTTWSAAASAARCASSWRRRSPWSTSIPTTHVITDPEFVRPQRPGVARRRSVQGPPASSDGRLARASRS